MKHLLCAALFPALFGSNLFADRFYYTVVAKEGLTLYAEASVDSEKLSHVPFMTTVEFLGYRGGEHPVTIDDEEIKCVWVLVRFGGTTGYMFSSHLYPGSLPYDNTLIHEAYTTLDENALEYEEPVNGDYATLNFLKVDLFENWYGVVVGRKGTLLVPVEINYRFLPRIVQGLHVKTMSDEFWFPTIGVPLPVEYKISPMGEYHFFIGTDETLIDSVDSQLFYTQQGTRARLGRFLHPWQEHHIMSPKGSIEANGFIENSKSDDSKAVLYELIFKKNDTLKEVEIPLNYHSNRLPVKDCVTRQQPELLWAGDINSDGYPDLILDPVMYYEGCGGSVSPPLIMSITSNEKTEYRIVGRVNSGSLLIQGNE